MIADCTALILAGGESRRMGQDKASLWLGGQTLLEHVIGTVQPLFAEVLVSVREPRADCTLPQVCDDPQHAGPLAGLAAGLAHSQAAWVFVVACDMPLISSQLIEFIGKFRDGCDAVVPVVQGFSQPMLAFYRVSILSELRALQAGSGKKSMAALLAKLNVRYVHESEIQVADLHRFFDLDTPQDVASLSQIF